MCKASNTQGFLGNIPECQYDEGMITPLHCGLHITSLVCCVSSVLVARRDGKVQFRGSTSFMADELLAQTPFLVPVRCHSPATCRVARPMSFSRKNSGAYGLRFVIDLQGVDRATSCCAQLQRVVSAWYESPATRRGSRPTSCCASQYTVCYPRCTSRQRPLRGRTVDKLP